MVTIARSSSSSRSFAVGNGSPYAACSRSHQPAPMPTNARPPVRADSVAAALAVTPAGRKVTGVHSVPSSRPVPSPASAPRVTHGSGIGSHARPTWGIWIRWSIRASPAKPASSAARATSPSHASGSSPHGNRETWSTIRSPRLLVRSSAGAGAGAGGSGGGRRGRPRPAPRGPSPRRRARGPPRGPCRSWPASAGAGTGRSRVALRRRHSAASVVDQHHHGRQPGGPCRCPPGAAGARRPGRACRRRSSGRGRAGQRRSCRAA